MNDIVYDVWYVATVTAVFAIVYNLVGYFARLMGFRRTTVPGVTAAQMMTLEGKFAAHERDSIDVIKALRQENTDLRGDLRRVRAVRDGLVSANERLREDLKQHAELNAAEHAFAVQMQAEITDLRAIRDAVLAKFTPGEDDVRGVIEEFAQKNLAETEPK